MISDRSLGDGHMRKDICSACDDSPTCRLHERVDLPVFYCEEYRREPGRQREIPEDCPSWNDRNARTPAFRSGEARNGYIGLCRTCLKLPTCAFLKPGGGTWECESHE